MVILWNNTLLEGESMGFAQTSLIDPERYLAPANGEERSLFASVTFGR